MKSREEYCCRIQSTRLDKREWTNVFASDGWSTGRLVDLSFLTFNIVYSFISNRTCQNAWSQKKLQSASDQINCGSYIIWYTTQNKITILLLFQNNNKIIIEVPWRIRAVSAGRSNFVKYLNADPFSAHCRMSTEILGGGRRFDTGIPDCHGLCADLRQLLSGYKPPESFVGIQFQPIWLHPSLHSFNAFSHSENNSRLVHGETVDWRDSGLARQWMWIWLSSAFEWAQTPIEWCSNGDDISEVYKMKRLIPVARRTSVPII